MNPPTLLALVEDNPTLRKRLVEHMTYFPEVRLVLAAGSGEELLAGIAALPEDKKPQVVLMDIELPGINGIETTRRLKLSLPEVEIMMLTVFEDDEKLFESIRAGASGYMLKDESPVQIVRAIHELREGGAPMSSVMARKVLGYLRLDAVQPMQPSNEPQGRPFDLTDRELEILRLLVKGMNYIQVGDQLNISPQTVRSHIKNIYKKMHVHTRAEAVRVAMDRRAV